MCEERGDRRGGLFLSAEFETPPPTGAFISTRSNLLPHLPVLHHQLLKGYDREEDSEKRRAKFLDLEFLPYALKAAKTAIEQFIHAQEELVCKAFPEGDSYRGRRQLDWWEIGYSVDSFLDASVRTQDAMIKYWLERFARNLPRSLRDVVNDRKGCRAKLPKPVLRELDAYWRKSGSLIRTYRDLSQHYAIVASEVEAVPGEMGGFVVRAFLPNNPQEKSTRPLKYEDPEIPVYPFLEVHFKNLLCFAYAQTRMMILENDPDARQLVGNYFRVAKLLGADGGKWYRMFSCEEFHERIEQFQHQLDGRRWPQEVPLSSK